MMHNETLPPRIYAPYVLWNKTGLELLYKQYRRIARDGAVTGTSATALETGHSVAEGAAARDDVPGIAIQEASESSSFDTRSAPRDDELASVSEAPTSEPGTAQRVPNTTHEARSF